MSKNKMCTRYMQYRGVVCMRLLTDYNKTKTNNKMYARSLLHFHWMDREKRQDDDDDK